MDKGGPVIDTNHSANIGTVVSVRGSVVDVRFDQQLPPIYTVLRTGLKQEIREDR
jgi:F-type H+-transporting ATPase subunit beta